MQLIECPRDMDSSQKRAGSRAQRDRVCLLPLIIKKKVLPVANAPELMSCSPGQCLLNVHTLYCELGGRVLGWQGGTASIACFLPVRNVCSCCCCCTTPLALSPSRHYREKDSGHKSGPGVEKCIVDEDSTGMTAKATPTPL
ncbi:uncharacterized [Tachysurus ichikawai]